MQQLFAFIFRYRVALVFIGVEFFCLYLIYSRNDYQKYAMVNTTNAVTGSLHGTRSDVVEYFSLDEKNEALARENAELEKKRIELESRNEELARKYKELQKSLMAEQADSTDSTKTSPAPLLPNETVVMDTSTSQPKELFKVYSGKVVNNSIHRQNNYLTINLGEKDGIEPGMGVITMNGIVGLVVSTSNGFSLVASVLHSQSRISAKIKKSNTLGTVQWTGRNQKDFELNYIARHVKLSLGDTIVTSGFNAVFPEGIPIGTVKSFELPDNQSFYDVEIELITDLSDLNYIYVVENIFRKEQKKLENEALLK